MPLALSLPVKNTEDFDQVPNSMQNKVTPDTILIRAFLCVYDTHPHTHTHTLMFSQSVCLGLESSFHKQTYTPWPCLCAIMPNTHFIRHTRYIRPPTAKNAKYIFLMSVIFLFELHMFRMCGMPDSYGSA